MPKLEMFSDSWGNFSANCQEAVSGGQFVKAMSAATATGANTPPSDVLEVMLCDASSDEDVCVGIALDNAASGERVTVATRGLIKTYAVSALTAGKAVQASSDANQIDGVKTLETGSYIVPGPRSIGTALDDAASGERVFVNLNVNGSL